MVGLLLVLLAFIINRHFKLNRESFYTIGLVLLAFNPELADLNNKSELQAQLGVPHSRIHVELGFILKAGTCQIINFAQNPRQSQSVQGTELNLGGTPHRKSVYIFSEQGTNRGWGHRTYFLNRGPIGGNTAQARAPSSHWIC